MYSRAFLGPAGVVSTPIPFYKWAYYQFYYVDESPQVCWGQENVEMMCKTPREYPDAIFALSVEEKGQLGKALKAIFKANQ